MPPPPPLGPVELYSWLLALIGAAIIVVCILLLLKYLSRQAPSRYEGTARSSELEPLLKELIKEIRLLREDIDKLRREIEE